MITREQMIEQSVQDYVRRELFDERNYPEEQVELLDAFPHNRFEGPLDKNYIALGFNFDDPGRQAEMGSDLTIRNYTLEFFVFGLTPVWGRNLAHTLKFGIENEGIIPLLDIGEIGKPQIDSLVVDAVRAEHQPISDPAPHEENIWITFVVVEDTYHARLV